MSGLAPYSESVNYQSTDGVLQSIRNATGCYECTQIRVGAPESGEVCLDSLPSLEHTSAFIDTLITPPGTEFTVDLDATSIELPVVGGSSALRRAFGSGEN